MQSIIAGVQTIWVIGGLFICVCILLAVLVYVYAKSSWVTNNLESIETHFLESGYPLTKVKGVYLIRYPNKQMLALDGDDLYDLVKKTEKEAVSDVMDTYAGLLKKQNTPNKGKVYAPYKGKSQKEIDEELLSLGE